MTADDLRALTEAGDFPAVAQTLLTRAVLVAGDARYWLTEVELYLDPDPYIHADPRQVETSGAWYFHRQNGKGYKGGTFKGLDVTCGPPGTGGGVLIRAVARLGDLAPIEGPCKVVDEILRATGDASVGALARRIPGGEDAPAAFAPESPLRLEVAGEARDARVYSARRVGLSDRHPAHRGAPLRLLTDVRRTRKDKGALLRALVAEHGLLAAGAIAGKSRKQMERYGPPPADESGLIPDDDPIWQALGL